MKTLLCNCNQTMTLDAPAIARALAQTPQASPDGLGTVHTLLCRREAGAFQRAALASTADGEPMLVACTQESRLFRELNDATEGAAGVAERPIRFVNIRETAGWGAEGRAATPKIAALIAAAQLPPPEPLPAVGFASRGRCLVIGNAEAAERAAALLDDTLDTSVLVCGGGALAQRHDRATHAGRVTRIAGWLGRFDVEWTSSNPIDLDLCTRCNACLAACPEGAIGLDYQVDSDACRAHRACVQACDAAGAIDFGRAPVSHAEAFDLVLDLRAEPAFTRHQPPQGYVHARADDAPRVADAVRTLRALVGEFDQPRFVEHEARLCAHSRNERIGCNACIEVCSAGAIRSDAGRKGRIGSDPGGIVVDAHLCVGCGACSTVCPSGAMRHRWPGPALQGRRVQTLLRAYAAAGGRDAALLIHSEGAGSARVDEIGRGARLPGSGLAGIPARVIPLPVWHTASVGIELWLAAIAHGANQVWVLTSDEEAPEYHAALAEQMALAQALLAGLGYAGQHLRLLHARDARDLHELDAALRAAPAQGVAQPAAFAVQQGKRSTLEFALDHLVAQAPARARGALPDAVALPAAGSPWGSVDVDTAKCTLCLSCVGACPAAALADNPDRPQLKFIEKNCVQCGLCATTCPEDAIRLVPRMWLADDGRARREARVLAEMPPYGCVRCGKPFGTLRAVEAMIARLAGHSAFQGAAAERLKMCADCRVIDIHTSAAELRITDL